MFDPTLPLLRVLSWVRVGSGMDKKRYVLVAVYLYLFYVAGNKVNHALVTVESKLDVARTIGGALMCLTVPLATYQVCSSRQGLRFLAHIASRSHTLNCVPSIFNHRYDCYSRVNDCPDQMVYRMAILSH